MCAVYNLLTNDSWNIFFSVMQGWPKQLEATACTLDVNKNFMVAVAHSYFKSGASKMLSTLSISEFSVCSLLWLI